MKPTRIKVSVSQDGLLPQETADVASIEFPALPKKLLKALGFERVDATTFVGVLPVFVNLGDQQEIEIELGVGIPEMRKKVLEILTSPNQEAAKEVQTEASTDKKTSKSDTKSKAKTKTKTKSSKSSASEARSSKGKSASDPEKSGDKTKKRKTRSK